MSVPSSKALAWLSIFALMAIFALAPSWAEAEEAVSTSATQGTTGSGAAEGSSNSGKKVTPVGDAPAQKPHYEGASASASDASEGQSAVAVIHTVAAIPCAITCAAYAGLGSGAALEPWCTYVALGAAGADAVITKNVAGAFSQTASLLGPKFMAKKPVDASGRVVQGGADAAQGSDGAAKGADAVASSSDAGAKTTEGGAKVVEASSTPAADASAKTAETTAKAGEQGAKDGGKEIDGMSCVTTALELASAGAAAMTAQQSSDLSGAMDGQMQRLDGGPITAPKTSAAKAGNTGAGSGGGVSNAPGGTATTPTVADDKGGFGGCAAKRRNGETQSFLSCMSQLDPGFPKALLDPKFQDAFQKETGRSIDDVLKLPDTMTPAEKVAASIANGPSGIAPSAAASIVGTMDQVAQEVLRTQGNEDTSSAYASRGGAGGKKGGKGDGFDLGGMMNGLLSQLNGEGEKKKEEPTGVSALDFKMANRTPEQIEQDRTISIFQRVSFRYIKARDRIEELAWVTQYNRTVAQSMSRSPASSNSQSQTPASSARK